VPESALTSLKLAWLSRIRLLKIQLQGFLEVFEGFFLGRTLTGDVDSETLRNAPVALAPHRR